MLSGPPGRRDLDAACAAFGVAPGVLADLAAAGEAPGLDGQCALWADNVDAAVLFQRLCGQWRMGPGGPVALDYTALPVVAGLLRLGRRRQREAFEPLRVMEAEALAWFDEQQQG